MTIDQLRQLQANRKAKTKPGAPVGANILIPADVHRQTKARAALEGKTLSEAIVEALTTWVGRK